MEWSLVKTKTLKPIEMVFPNHLDILTNMILNSNILRKPLIVDKDNLIVLDGSHRHVFLLMHGFVEAPVIKVDYSDPHVRVGSHLKHRFLDDGNITITKEEVITRALNGILFPPRTTRHFFPFRKDNIDMPLDDLKRGPPRDMSKHIAKVDIQKEIKHNYKYISEIDEETKEIMNYLAEQDITKSYLKRQIKRMEQKRDKSNASVPTI